MASMFEHLTEDQIAEYKESFAVFDTDGDGTISKSELRIFMKSIGQNPTDAEITRMIQSVDENNNGLIDFPEFLILMEHKMRDTDDEMMVAFKQFDINGDGQISRQELKLTMTKLCGNLSEEQIDHIVKEVDKDGDGQINYDEFVEMMSNKNLLGGDDSKKSKKKAKKTAPKSSTPEKDKAQNPFACIFCF